jgi:hypothetical protein
MFTEEEVLRRSGPNWGNMMDSEEMDYQASLLPVELVTKRWSELTEQEKVIYLKKEGVENFDASLKVLSNLPDFNIVISGEEVFGLTEVLSKKYLTQYLLL